MIRPIDRKSRGTSCDIWRLVARLGSRAANSRQSNQWKTLERVKGIEPSSSAWKAVALPLSYTRAGETVIGRRQFVRSPSRMTDLCFSAMVGEVGLEPTKA